MRLKLTGEEPAPPPPTWIKPQPAKLVDKAPSGPDWLHEIKLDGYRMVSLSARRPRLGEAVAAYDAGLTVVETVWPLEWVQQVRADRDKTRAAAFS